MPIKVTIDLGAGAVDYTQYVVSASIKVEDNINTPAVVTFSLSNITNAFIVPLINSYVRIFSTTLNKTIFSGFVSSVPAPEYLGAGGNVPKFGFQRFVWVVNATSDEYLLNVKSVPFIPAFVNQTQGQILQGIAAALAPGFFDTTNVAAGDLIPYYIYDPSKKWSDVAKELGDQSRMHHWALDKKLYFQPLGDAPLGILYDETQPQSTFYPAVLTTNVSPIQPLNDAIVIGDVEPQNNWDNYFIGNGITNAFDTKHKLFRGTSSILLKDDWSETSFQKNTWNIVDLQHTFSLVGSLNSTCGPSASGTIGTSYIEALNGIELGGHLDLQHGEFSFNDRCNGLVGGIYSSSTVLTQANCLAGFLIQPATGTTVTVTASGASGLQIQPILNGQPAGTPVPVLANHNYHLRTLISSNTFSRYNKAYRTLAGAVFGNLPVTSLVDVTFIIYDINLAAFNLLPGGVAPIFVPPPTPSKQYFTNNNWPSFGTYVLLNEGQLNLNVSSTLIAQPPQGKLVVASLYGPTGTQLPVLVPGQAIQYALGNGYGEQVATTAAGTDFDLLQFYTDTIPAVGARIRFQSWESGKSMARVQNPVDIATEARIVGDDGVRTFIYTNLQPLPRTSVDCESAASALLSDYVKTQWDGEYEAHNHFWDSTKDYPKSGRFLAVNTLQRGISGQNFLVRKVTTSVLEMYDEVIDFTIEFGQDTYIEKLLTKFVSRDQNVLTPKDSANPPLLQFIQNIGTTYTGSLDAAKAIAIDSTTVTIDLGVAPVTGCEVRLSDTGWGQNNVNRVGVFATQQFTLARTNLNQIWYLRQVNGAAISRFSKVIHVGYPLLPAPPIVVQTDTTDILHPIITFGFNGDIRNIYGLEIRDADNVTVLLQRAVFSTSELIYVFDNSLRKTRSQTFNAYFFNLMWGYSTTLTFTLTIPQPLVIPSIDETGGTLVMSLSPTGGRADLIEFQISSNANFTVMSATGSLAVSPISGAAMNFVHPLTLEDLLQQRWFQTRGRDKIGFAPFTQIQHIYTPQGLISFDGTNNVLYVGPPPAPGTDPTVPAPLAQYAQDIINDGWDQYVRQINRVYR